MEQQREECNGVKPFWKELFVSFLPFLLCLFFFPSQHITEMITEQV